MGHKKVEKRKCSFCELDLVDNQQYESHEKFSKISAQYVKHFAF